MNYRKLQRLTKEQLDSFHQEGYVVVHDIFDPEDLAPVCAEISEMIAWKAKELQDKGELQNSFPEGDFTTRLAQIAAHNLDAANQIVKHLEGKAGGGYNGKEMFSTITHPKLMAVIEDIIGDEIVGSSVYRIRPKLPKLSRGDVPWHQDSGYFMPHCDPELIVTCWLPLVDATIENGCLSFLPQSHHNGIVRHHTGGNAGFLEIREEDLPPAEAVAVPIPLGGAVFFTNHTPHCSTPNESDLVRWSLDLRYQSANVPNNINELPEHFSEDQAETEMACYPPEADFLIQSSTDPEKVIRHYEQFAALRSAYEQRFKARVPGLRRWSN